MKSQFITNVMDHLITHWSICGILFLFDIYIYKYGLWEKFKVNSVSIPDNWSNIILRVLFNQFFITFPIFYFLSFEQGEILIFENLYKIPITFLALEVLFYHAHRVLHFPWFYKNIHKTHHLWTAPLAISATYAHPFEHFFANVMPIVLAGKIANLNFSTMRLWHIFTLVNTLVMAHGGFKIKGYYNMHDKHHTSFIYNYGAIGLLDRVYGTYVR